MKTVAAVTITLAMASIACAENATQRQDNAEIELIYRLDYACLDQQIEATRRLSPDDKDGKSALEKELERLEAVRRDVPQLALRATRERIKEAGVKGAEVELFDNDRRLRVMLPSMPPPQYEKVKSGIQVLGRISFHLVASKDHDGEIIRSVLDPTNHQHSYGGYDLYYIEHKTQSGAISREAVVIQKLPLVDGSQVEHASAESDGQGGWLLRLRFNTLASVRLKETEGVRKGQRLALVMDGHCASAPTIEQRLEGDLHISGSFTKEEAQDVAYILRFRIPPLDLILENERSLKHTEQTR